MENEILSQIDIFKNIDSKIEDIFKNIKMKIIQYQKGEIIFFAGDICKELAIITKGIVKTQMQDEQGNIKTIENIEPYNLIAPAFLFGAERKIPVDVCSIEDTTLLLIDKTDWMKILQKDKKILENYLNIISNRTNFLSKKIWFGFSEKTIEEKLLFYLNNIRNDSNIAYINITITELAEKFGVARPSVSRALKKLIEKGFINKNGKEIEILKR